MPGCQELSRMAGPTMATNHSTLCRAVRSCQGWVARPWPLTTPYYAGLSGAVKDGWPDHGHRPLHTMTGCQELSRMGGPTMATNHSILCRAVRSCQGWVARPWPLTTPYYAGLSGAVKDGWPDHGHRPLHTMPGCQELSRMGGPTMATNHSILCRAVRSCQGWVARPWPLTTPYYAGLSGAVKDGWPDHGH